MKKFFLLIGLLALRGVVELISAQGAPRSNDSTMSNSLIWKGNQFAAFTTLIIHDNVFYCAFREANRHVELNGTDNGRVVVLRSTDGDSWEKFRTIDDPGYDLRDPQFFIDSDKHLNLLIERVKYANRQASVRQSCYLDLSADPEQVEPVPLQFNKNVPWNWLWNVNSINGTLYGFTYLPHFELYKSTNGRQYEFVCKPDLGDDPSESAIIDLDKKTFLAVVRQTATTAIGLSHDQGKTWTWKRSRHRVGCPKLIRYKGKIIMAARDTGLRSHTSIYVYNKKKKDFDVMMSLPDSGDCSYPGIAIKDGRLFVSYYNTLGKNHSDIYLAKIKL